MKYIIFIISIFISPVTGASNPIDEKISFEECELKITSIMGEFVTLSFVLPPVGSSTNLELLNNGKFKNFLTFKDQNKTLHSLNIASKEKQNYEVTKRSVSNGSTDVTEYILKQNHKSLSYELHIRIHKSIQHSKKITSIRVYFLEKKDNHIHSIMELKGLK